jgi:hypothetical protein
VIGGGPVLPGLFFLDFWFVGFLVCWFVVARLGLEAAAREAGFDKSKSKAVSPACFAG